MRIQHSIKNIYISIFSQLIIILLGFISRKVFIDSLGVEYLGIQGLLTNVLSLLTLIEAGIGTSIVYSLYKPLSEKDEKKIIPLIQLFRKSYRIITLIVLTLSVFLYPFIGMIVNDTENINNLTIIYFLFVLQNLIPYINAHKVSLINADQKAYVIVKIKLLFRIAITISTIVVLIYTENYILFLIMSIIVLIIQQLVISYIVNKRYPYIKTKTKYSLDEKTKEKLVKNIKALSLHNIGTFAVFGTDNILISVFISVSTVGLYSNYTMIINQINLLIRPILYGIGDSVGNLIATEGIYKRYSIFRVLYLINFWVYSICVIFLFNLLEPFINLWLGYGYLLDSYALIIILVNLYLTGLRASIEIFKSKAGIFVQDKYAPLMESVINLIASIILANYFGLIGIFLGTTLSTISIVFWNAPRLVYKHVFEKSVWGYFRIYIHYLLLTVITGIITTHIIDILINGESLLNLLYMGIICIVVPNIIYILIFHKTEEFKYVFDIVKKLILRFKKNVRAD